MITTTENSPSKFVCYGEVLWDILPGGQLPGGAPMNVAYHLNKLGSNAVMISRTGQDELGKKIREVLITAGVSDQLIQTDELNKTGVVYATPNDKHEMIYEIVYPVAWDFIEWKEEYSSLITEADYLIFGSLSSRNEVSRNTLYRLIEKAKTKVFDINLRPPHYNNLQLEYLLDKTDILKMNNSELNLVASWYDTHIDTRDKIQLIQDRFNIPTIIVTMGEEGAIVNHNAELFFQEAYKVDVADTIGSGDSFLAGFMHKFSKGKSIAEALKFACAVGALVASKAGGCPEYSVGQIEDMLAR